ncbi:MAG: hypothetical protein PHD02_03510 [Bacilli bacterium]|nr:hypothetical protein [Bacilli bacterium]
MNIDLSQMIDTNEASWKRADEKLCDEFFDVLKSINNIDFHKEYRIKNSAKLFRYLRTLLINYYLSDMIKAFNIIGVSEIEYYKKITYVAMITITRNNPNAERFINLLINKKIINSFQLTEDGFYIIDSPFFGKIEFAKISDSLLGKEVEGLLNRKDLIGGCHEVTLELLRRKKSMIAITALSNMSINEKFYHSFLLDDNNVIDLTANIIVPINNYYELNSIEEISRVSSEDNLRLGLEYDKSKTLFPLLRIAAFKQILNIKTKN